MSKKPKTLLLLDGNAIIHRAYHALPPLTTKSGEMVNAVYGFSSTLLSVLERFRPEFVAASFDLAAPTFRHKAYADYKATRQKAPDDLYAQIPRVKEVVAAFGIPIYEQEGFEADDVIGTIAEQAARRGVNVIIVTGDADALQLVDERTRVFTMRRGITDTVLYDAEGVIKKYGISPSQLADFKGLRGDPSDNIPGVKGVGEKTASELLKKYERLEGVYEHLEEISPSVREKLVRDKAQAFLSRDLGEIRTDVAVSFNEEEAQTKEFDRERVAEKFRELNFFSLLKRLGGAETASGDKQIVRGVSDKKFFILSEENEKKIQEEIEKSKCVSVYFPTAEKGISGVAISWKTARAVYIPYTSTYKKIIRKILENERIKKVSYDAKTARKILHRYGLSLAGTVDDVMLEAYILNPGASMDLDHLALEKLGIEPEEKKNSGQLSLGVATEKETMEKVCTAADIILRLHSELSREIDEVSATQPKGRTLRAVLEDIELPVADILGEMEENGIGFDKRVFRGAAQTMEKKISMLEKSIYALCGREFNLNSPKQLAQVLFGDLKISTEGIKKIKTGFSTRSSELIKLRGEHTVIPKIEEYRELFKLKTTYVDVLPQLVGDDGRIHTTFKQAVAATGRLSSVDPNLQNIPVRTELGALLRTAFIAPVGYRLVSADYSQIDLRCAAHISGDEKLREAFFRGDDIHTATAAEINGVAPSQVTKTMRRAAKALNFGVLYGMSSFGFSQSAGVSLEEAQTFINAYMERFSGIAAYLRQTREAAGENGFVETPLGRRRYIPEINSPNMQLANAAERMAINMPIQGLTADIMKLAMIAASGVVRDYGDDARMLLQVHDELIFEVREEKEENFMARIKEAMEKVYPLSVPLVVSVKSGSNWGEL